MGRKTKYATFVHKAGFTVNGLAREIEADSTALRRHFRGEPKQLSAERIEAIRQKLNLTRREYAAKLKEWEKPKRK